MTGEQPPSKPKPLAKPASSRWVNALLGTTPKNVEIAKGGASDYADRLAREIAAEHALVTARMTWTLSLQGFLFTAFVLATNGKADSQDLVMLVGILPFAGLLTAVLGFAGTLAAFARINALKRIWHGHEDEFERHGPRPFSTTFGGLVGRLPPVAISATLIACWFALLLT
ncbi:MAG TPA: hypothetical protein VK614_11655 [Allosphingosinicella sp.]|nr:hypothetical protein [Allosphingosinicella sp.]